MVDENQTPAEEEADSLAVDQALEVSQVAEVEANEAPVEVDFALAGEDFVATQDQNIEIEELEFIETERVQSIVESVLFATDKPVSLSTLKQAFQGTNIKSEQIRHALNALAVEYAGAKRGVTIEEVGSGYQLRSKVDNANYLKNMIKQRPFKLSGPALETLAIIAYKQPVIKAEIDEIRGVESGHLLRALMEKGLANFAGKSELPGKPMQYQTTRKFLEIFGLRNLRELPSLSEIDELLPEGIGEVEEKKATLGDLTGELSEQVTNSYSTGEDELLKITDQLNEINTSSEFFEEEKKRQKMKRDQERARDIREALSVGEAVDAKERRWLERYETELAEIAAAALIPPPVEAPAADKDESVAEVEESEEFDLAMAGGEDLDSDRSDEDDVHHE